MIMIFAAFIYKNKNKIAENCLVFFWEIACVNIVSRNKILKLDLEETKTEKERKKDGNK